MPAITTYTGPANTALPAFDSFDAVRTHLIETHGFPVLAAASPYPFDKTLSHSIASLAVHPTLEALLHILNNDLPSAHFLCRHMQDRPAWEGMYIHGLLHRIEGDYRNAEAWYSDVAESDVFRHCWAESGGLAAAVGFIRMVERLRKHRVGSLEELREHSRREIDALIGWCVGKFGADPITNGLEAWVEPGEKHRDMAEQMLTGGEGWRQF